MTDTKAEKTEVAQSEPKVEKSPSAESALGRKKPEAAQREPKKDNLAKPVLNNDQDVIKKENARDANGDGESADGKKILHRGVSGIVRWFDHGYGFIQCLDTNDDVFVHQSAVVRKNPKKMFASLDTGEKVEFDVIEGTKGRQAANVTGPGGKAVKGSRFVPCKSCFLGLVHSGHIPADRLPRRLRKGEPVSGKMLNKESGEEADHEEGGQRRRPSGFRRRRRNTASEGAKNDGENKDVSGGEQSGGETGGKKRSQRVRGGRGRRNGREPRPKKEEGAGDIAKQVDGEAPKPISAN